MKKLVFLSMLLVTSFSLCAQERDVTRFLGIPVDGSKKDMIQKLKAKGFESSDYDPNTLEGEFNGTEVWIGVATNNNKVWRVGVKDKNGRSEGDIKIRYNALCRQFENNSKYGSIFEDQTIPEDEDISYEMSVNNKRYQAIFYQHPVITDNLEQAVNNKHVWFTIIKESYGEYKIMMFYDNEYNHANGEDL
ncbi:MAG: hypothetical protein MSS82_02895 [Bacteroidales bacterium]|nr:hypothetical protein [Bacteroidales bacterium]